MVRLAGGEYAPPWIHLHVLKDYFDMRPRTFECPLWVAGSIDRCNTF